MPEINFWSNRFYDAVYRDYESIENDILIFLDGRNINSSLKMENTMNNLTKLSKRIIELIEDNLIWGQKGKWAARKELTKKLLCDYDPHVSSDEDPKFSFLQLDKKGLIDVGKPRLKLSPARFLTRRLNLNDNFLTDLQTRNISDIIINEFFDSLQIRLDSGKKITENYANDVGGYSCMTGSSAKCTILYEMNPDRFQQLVMTLNNDSARAIISYTDEDITYMDKVYSTSRHLNDKMHEYSSEKGWPNYYKENYSKLTISNLRWKDGNVPYMDTFKHYKINSDNTLTICTHLKDLDGYLESTDGYVEENSFCCCCNDHIDRDDLYTFDDEYYCEYCYNETVTFCDQCEDEICREHAFVLENRPFCERCYNKLSTPCDNCGEDYNINNMIECNSDSTANNPMSIQNEKYCEDCYNNKPCDRCGDEVGVESLNDDNYCDDCVVFTNPCDNCGKSNCEKHDDLCDKCFELSLIKE